MKIFFISFIFLLLLLDYLEGHKSGFERFIKNPLAISLVKSYEKKEIKTLNELHEQLMQKGIQISICTLKRYLHKIKIVFAPTKNKVDPAPKHEAEKCFSKKLTNTIFIIGNESNWRKYIQTNEKKNDIYISCSKCLYLREKENNTRSIISTAVLRQEILEKLKAEQVDREQRKENIKCISEGKTIWRQGLNKLREADLNKDKNPQEENSITIYYPSWITVRRAYNRKRKQIQGSDSNDPYDVPERLQLTKIGALMLVMGKTIVGTEWLIYKNQEHGILLFASMMILFNCTLIKLKIGLKLIEK